MMRMSVFQNCCLKKNILWICLSEPNSSMEKFKMMMPLWAILVNSDCVQFTFTSKRIKATLNKKCIVTWLGKHFMSLMYPVLPQPQYKTTQQIRGHNEKTLATLAKWWEMVCLRRLFHLQFMLTVQSLFNVRNMLFQNFCQVIQMRLSICFLD